MRMKRPSLEGRGRREGEEGKERRAPPRVWGRMEMQVHMWLNWVLPTPAGPTIWRRRRGREERGEEKEKEEAR